MKYLAISLALMALTYLGYISQDLMYRNIKVKKNGNVVFFYEEKKDTTIYKGCATLEDTTITLEEAKKAFFSKDTTDSPIFFDLEKGMIKRKIPQD